MGDAFYRLFQARTSAWGAGLELERSYRMWQHGHQGTAEMNRQVSRVDQAIEELRDALTLGTDSPRPTVAEAKIDLMLWGVDQGFITPEQYDEWVASEPK